MRLATIVPVLLISALCGCASSPYDKLENWLIRDDPIRPFTVQADVIYLQGHLYTKSADVLQLHAYANSEVGRERFKGVARVFSPLVANRDDLELAIKWYFKYHHEGHRSFAFIGEGECGRLLREYELDNAKSLRKKGLIASYYTDTADDQFVTDDMVREIKEAAARAHYHDVWNREMPE